MVYIIQEDGVSPSPTQDKELSEEELAAKTEVSRMMILFVMSLWNFALLFLQPAGDDSHYMYINYITVDSCILYRTYRLSVEIRI